ncbi:MAG: hypothetical protein OXH36_03910 [Bdellovibrionales bacterium]|nr:hypothetical protein [Bdellovibrionales bacterium]
MKIFSYSAIQLFSYFFFCTLAFASNSFTPYKVIGVSCMPGDLVCEPISSGVGPFSDFGYYIKSNVRPTDADFYKIRPNMFTKAFLDRELKTLDAKMQGLSVKLSRLKYVCKKREVESPEVGGVYKPSPFKPYKVVGVSCTPGDLYCEPISSGPFSGYYIKSNVMPKDAEFDKIRPNMFTKAALNREKEKRLIEIKDLSKKVSALQKCEPTAKAFTSDRTAAEESTEDTGVIK